MDIQRVGKPGGLESSLGYVWINMYTVECLIFARALLREFP